MLPPQRSSNTASLESKWPFVSLPKSVHWLTIRQHLHMDLSTSFTMVLVRGCIASMTDSQPSIRFLTDATQLFQSSQNPDLYQNSTHHLMTSPFVVDTIC